MNTQWKGKQYYSVLGIRQNATAEDIKKAYRKMSLKYHPDKPTGNQEKFREINEAYTVLRDPSRRQQYDREQWRSTLPKDNASIQAFMDMYVPMIKKMVYSSKSSNETAQQPLGLDDTMLHIFAEQLLPGFHKKPTQSTLFQDIPIKPTPITKTVYITLEQAYTGVSLPVSIERWIEHDHVKTTERETVYVDIPKGVDTNEILVLNGKGNQTSKGVGDVRVHIQLHPHSLFERDGLTLLYKKTISLRESMCGFSFELPHINGKRYNIRNNKGTIVQSGHSKTIHGLGCQRGEHKGDLQIVFTVKYPEKLQPDMIDALDTLLSKLDD